MKRKSLHNKSKETLTLEALEARIKELEDIKDLNDKILELLALMAPRVVYLPSAPLIIERHVPAYPQPFYPQWPIYCGTNNIQLCNGSSVA